MCLENRYSAAVGMDIMDRRINHVAEGSVCVRSEGGIEALSGNICTFFYLNFCSLYPLSCAHG